MLKIKKTAAPRFSFSQVASELRRLLTDRRTTLGVICLLCALSPPVAGASPFGAAVFAAAFASKTSYIYMPVALVGAAIRGASAVEIGKYLFTMAAFSLIAERVLEKRKFGAFHRAIVFSLCLLVSGVCFLAAERAIYGGILIYDVLSLVLECVVALLSVAAFSRSLPTLFDTRLRRSVDGDDMFCFVFTAAVALRGLSVIPKIGIFDISEILCILFVLIFSSRLGAAAGATAGITMGVMSGLGAGRVDTSAAAYAFCGLVSGYFGRFGSVAAACAFLLGNSAITAFTNGSTEVLIDIFDIFAASVIFLMMPPESIGALCGYATQNPQQSAIERARNYTRERLHSFARALAASEKMAQSCYEMPSAKDRLFERTVRKACSGCPIANHCWNKEHEASIERLEKMIDSCASSGSAELTLSPSYCLRPEKLCRTFEEMYSLYRLDMQWEDRLCEVRASTAERLGAAVGAIERTADELGKKVVFDAPSSDVIAAKLKRAGMWVNDVQCLREGGGEIREVVVNLKGCGGFRQCENSLADVVSEVCGEKMRRIGGKNCEESDCTVTYRPMTRFTPVFSAAGAAKGGREVSGDCFGARYVGKKCVLALCDGMGSGKTASRQAKSCVKTLLDLIEAGFSCDEALLMVNRALISGGETVLAAIDLCVIDLESGKTELIKAGGASAFFKSGSRVREIDVVTLPEGAKEEGEVRRTSLDAKAGDVLVMLSDGVMSLGSGAIVSHLESSDGKRPAQIADELIVMSKNFFEDGVHDDVTAVAVMLEKTA